MKSSVLALFLLAMAGCSPVDAPEVGIRVFNNMRDDTYVQIDNVFTGSTQRSFSARIHFGEYATISYPGVTALRLSRRSAKGIKYYQIECPPIRTGIAIRLIDVHLNRMPGGCSLVRVEERE